MIPQFVPAARATKIKVEQDYATPATPALVAAGQSVQEAIGNLQGQVSGRPVARVYLAAPQNFTAGVETTVNFDTVDYDTVNGWDATNKRYKPGVPGYYTIYASVQVKAILATYFNVFITKNGNRHSHVAGGCAGGQSWTMLSGGDTVYLGANDYIQISGFVGGTGNFAFGEKLGNGFATYVTFKYERP